MTAAEKDAYLNKAKSLLGTDDPSVLLAAGDVAARKLGHDSALDKYADV